MHILIGRGLAFCVHPHLAWPRLTVGGRVLLLGAYCGSGYALVLAALLAF